MTYWKLERPSKRSGKKWKVRVPTSSGRGKTVAFGDASMEDYTIHKDKSRRDDYRTRHQHDHIDNPYKAGFWSWWSLWGASPDLSKAHAVAVAKAKRILSVKRQDGNEIATSPKAHQLEARSNPNPLGAPSPTMAEVSGAVVALDVPKHLRAEFIQGFAVEWEHAHTVGYDVLTIGRIVLDHLAEDAHYYRKLRRARLNPQPAPPSERVQACFDTLLSMVREQYPDLVCALEVDERAGERGGESCARAYAYCEDLSNGSFRIAIASKMDDAEDSRVEGLLRHELAHAVLLHGGDLEHTERDADEVAEALFGSPLYYDHEDVQTTDPSAPGARRPRPEHLDDENGRTRDTPALDAADPTPYADASRNPAMPHQLETVEDVESCLDDCAAQGDAKTPRMLASRFSQQAKEVAGAQARMLTSLAKACRHCANAIEARLAGNIEHAMSCERLCERALADAQSPGRGNPSGDVYELIMGGIAAESRSEKAGLRAAARKCGLDVHPVGHWEWAFTGSKADLRKYLSSMIDDAEEVEGHLQRAVAVRGNPEWAKKLGRGLYKGARYAGETARDLYHGAREAYASRAASAGERRNPRRNPRFDQYEFRVSNSFLPALINGDTSGLSLSDEEALSKFYKHIEKLGPGHWAVVEDDAGFGRDEITGLGSDRALVAWMVMRRNPRRSNTHRLPGIGILTIRPDPEGARDQARVEVTKAFASEWDHDMLNRADLSRDVMKAVEKHRHGSNFYAVELTYRGREFFKIFPSGEGRENPKSRKVFIMCPVCESSFHVRSGAPLPPHRGLGGGLCSGSGSGGAGD